MIGQLVIDLVGMVTTVYILLALVAIPVSVAPFRKHLASQRLLALSLCGGAWIGRAGLSRSRAVELMSKVFDIPCDFAS